MSQYLLLIIDVILYIYSLYDQLNIIHLSNQQYFCLNIPFLIQYNVILDHNYIFFN